MLLKKDIQLPNDFFPTDKQKRRLKIKNSIARRCQNCGNYFITFVKKQQYYCYKCYRIKGKSAPVIDFEDLQRLY